MFPTRRDWTELKLGYQNISGNGARHWGNSGWKRGIPPGTPARGILASAPETNAKAGGTEYLVATGIDRSAGLVLADPA